MMQHRMYGDLIIALSTMIASPCFLYECIQMIRENNLSWNESLGPLSVCFVQIYVLLFSGLSFWYQSRTCSYAAFTCFLAYVQLSSLFQFPLAAGDNGLGVAVATQLIVASANTPHSFFVQMLMAVSVLINALASSVFSYPDGGIQAILPTISAYTAAFLFYEVGSLLYFSTGKIDIFKSKGISAAQLKSSNNWNWKQNWSLVAPVGIVGVLFLYGMMVEVLRGLHQDGYAENGQQKLLMTLILGAGGFCLVSFRQGFATTRNGTDNESFVPHVNLDKAFEDEDLSHLLYEHTVELRHRMYGDFVTVPFATISTFILCYDCLLFLQENEYDLKVATGPLLTCATLALMSFCSFWSFWYESWTASYAAFASRIALSVVVCLYHWPTQDSHLLPTQFIWHLFILTANTPHSFFNKMAMSLVDVISVVTLSYLSPVNTIPKNLTVILISMASFVVFQILVLLLFSSSKTINFFKAGTIKRQDTLFEDQNVAMVPVQAFGVALIVGYVLASFVIKEVLAIISEDVYYVVGICKLMGVSLVCICAVIFTRIFRHKAEAHRHAKILAESSAMLRMATSALNASSTAVAVVDEHRVITMYNPAFQFVLCHSDDTDLKNIQLEAVLNLSTEDLSMLQWAFQTSDKPTVEVDFVLGSKVIRVAVSAISMDAAEKLYYVVLQDLTEKYALQQAVSRARQAALGLLHAAGARQVGGSQPHLIAPEETNPNRG